VGLVDRHGDSINGRAATRIDKPRASAVNVALPAFAAERRAASVVAAERRRRRLQLVRGDGARSYRSISPARGRDDRAMGRQIRRRPLLLSIDGTDRRTDRRTLNRFIDTSSGPTVRLTSGSDFQHDNSSSYWCFVVTMATKCTGFELEA